MDVGVDECTHAVECVRVRERMEKEAECARVHRFGQNNYHQMTFDKVRLPNSRFPLSLSSIHTPTPKHTHTHTLSRSQNHTQALFLVNHRRLPTIEQ